MASDKVLSLEGAELLYNDIRARLVGIEQGGGNTGGGGTGTDGVGILSVVQTTTSTADKGENVVTVTLTDGRSSKFSVLNGSRGASGSPGTNGVDGKGINSITVSETPADGGANRVTINMTDGTSKSFSVLNGRTGSAGPQGEPGKDATIDSSIISYAEDSTDSEAITDVAAVNGKLVFNRGKAFAPISHLTMSTNPHGTTAIDVGAYTTAQVDALLANAGWAVWTYKTVTTGEEGTIGSSSTKYWIAVLPDMAVNEYAFVDIAAEFSEWTATAQKGALLVPSGGTYAVFLHDNNSSYQALHGNVFAGGEAVKKDLTIQNKVLRGIAIVYRID